MVEIKANSITNPQEYGRYAAEKVAKERVIREFNDFLTKCGSNLEAVDKTFQNLRGSWSGQHLPIISIKTVPYEDATLPELIQSDFEELRKVILTLAHLVEEMDFLVKEFNKFYYPLLYYGEAVDEQLLQQGDSHICAGRIFDVLQQLLSFVNHCYKVVKNVVAQLSKLYCSPDSGPRYFDVGESHFKIIFERLSNMLTCLVTLDSIINHNVLLREHVAQFQHVVRSVQHGASSFDASPEDLQNLDLNLDEISERVLSGTIFLRCVSQGFPANKALLEEVSANVKGFLEELCFRLEKEGEVDSLDNLRKFLGIVCLHVLHAHLGLKVDRRQLKIIMDVAKTSIVAVPLIGPCLWFPEQFLTLYLPRGDRAVDAKMVESVASNRVQFLRTKAALLAKDIPTWNAKILTWMTRLGGNSHSKEEMTDHCVMVLQGLRYASRLSAAVRLILNLHLAIQPVIGKTTVLTVFQTFEIIKALQVILEKELTAYPLAWTHLQQQLRRSVLEMIQSAAKKVASVETKRSSRTVLEALKLAELVLRGPCTASRVTTARLALAIACNAFRDDELPLLAQRLQKMEMLTTGIHHRLQDLTDCELLYWHKSLFSTYLADAAQRRFESDRLMFAIMAVYDCRTALGQAKHLADTQELIRQHEVFVRRAIERTVLEPLCTSVETELRIQSHSNLPAGTDRTPFKAELCSLTSQLSGQIPLNPHERVSLSNHVEQYLGQTFYNLAALASHDWRKYSQMRLLAELVFGLQPLPDRLPSQTQEQGLDVLEIMRNIHLFVTRFGYNLNNQFFVEQSSSSKHLSTIGIKHAANSIRTHGSGVVNTAVNFTYQFLRKKFFVFSQFLYDEHIKSRLMKDARYLRDLGSDSIKETAIKYPYERAEKFHRGIRKLGLNPLGQSYLDQFRLLVTQLGNALGYVRMLRSGSIHCSAESCAPVPDLAELVNLNESGLERLTGASSTGSLKNQHDTSIEMMSEGLFESLAKSNSSLSSLTASSCRALDKVLDDLAQNLSDSSDYFRLLVDVFRPFFRDPRHSHLRHFHLIVPPLTVNFAEHIVTCKEKLSKKNKQEASTFTDDGLAMGLAYCLSVLDQWKDFDSLQWFASVREYFDRERKAASQLPQDTLNLTLHRLDNYQQEFDLLFYNVNSARIFFRQERTTVSTSKPPSTA